MLQDEENSWKVTAVLNILMQLTEKSNINDQLRALEAGEPITEEVAGEFGIKPVYSMTGILISNKMYFISNLSQTQPPNTTLSLSLSLSAGFFSLVGLLRLYCLLGDYHMALSCIKHVQFKDKDMMALVPACQITANYYAGFAYFMIRKYANTIQL